MHSAGLELTKLTYTRLEDNLIRCRGDRLTPGIRSEKWGTSPLVTTRVPFFLGGRR